MISPRGDVLESHGFISPDGLDWIAEGRILGSNGLVLPVLRNIGYVLSSRFDWILGGHGFVFASINILGLLFQGISLILLLKYLDVKPQLQTLGLLIYFGSWIHFSSLYILPDSFAVGCLVLGITLFAVNESNDIKYIFIALLTLFIGSLFQFYVLAGFMFSIVFIITQKNSVLGRIAKTLTILFLMTTSIGIGVLWRNQIPHSSVPNHFDLLAINLNMLPFYIEIWASAFLLLFFLTIGNTKKKSIILSLRNWTIRYFVLFGLALLTLALFYQWPDSRIAYSGISLLLISFIAIFLTAFATAINLSKSKNLGASVNTKGIAIFVIALSLFMAPKDYWAPKFFETRPLHTWSLIIIKDFYDNDSSSYKDISVSIKSSCRDSNGKAQLLDSITTSSFSPYEKTILTSYATYFDCHANK